MSSVLYRNIRLLILTICLILVWGFSSFSILPRMEDPQLSQWLGKITTSFPGASPERVESLVTEKLEQELFKIEEIKTVTSTSRLGSSRVVIKLKDTVEDFDKVWSRVRDRIADVTPQLPPGALTPKYEEINQRAYTLIVALTWDLETPANYAILSRIAEELKDELRTKGGTEEIEFFGAPSEEIVVEINQANLAALGITPQKLSEQIRISDAKVSSGTLRSSNNDLLIEVETELDSLERIRQIPIGLGNNSGQLARLGDIANVKKGIQEPPGELAIINGKPGIALAVRIEPSIRIDRWMKRARQTLEEFRQSSPSGIDLQLLLDQNRYVDSRLNGLFQNLILGSLCVVVSTAVLMGWKAAIVVGAAIPLSVLMVFGGMRVLGIPLHQMSVTGLVIALGMLIDNAIVVVDEMQNLLRQGIPPQKAIAKTVKYLAIPLLASTLTTVLTFLPIALLPGDTGEFVGTISFSVILALLSSLLLSLTVIPALNGRMQVLNYEPGTKKNQLTFQGWWNTGFSIPRLTKVYRHTLSSILARPVVGVVLALILPITGFLMAGTLQEQFFPPADRDQFHIELELSSSASIEQTKSVVEGATEVILKHPEVLNVHWFLGTYAPAFYYNITSGGSKGGIPNYAAAMVQLTSPTKSRQLIRNLQKELDLVIPEARVLVKQLEQGPPFAPIELRIIGPNLNILKQLGNQAREELVKVANVTHTRSSLGEALPKLALSLDEEQARLTGLDNTQIAQQLNGNLEGTVGGSILEGTEELPVRVRLGKRVRGNLDQIATLDLLPTTIPSNQNPPTVPLSALGQIELVPELATITRRNGQRVNTVQGFITAGVLPSTVLADFKQRLETSDFQLPPGYSLEWGGESAERNEAVGNLLSTVGVLLVLMVATLVLSFGSFRSAGIIALVGIGSIGLALASLWMFDYPLGFMAILGTVGLVGVAINDSIVVLAALRSDSMARQGNRKAMVEVIVLSTRHVLTTTITTVAGFIPLLLDGGQFWPPLAICIAGGVGGATLLALLFVPCAYLLLFGRSPRVRDRQYRTLSIEHFNANSTPTVGGHHYE
ncbi:efflux RND transporter permease subunit [Moorena sp. SIO4G3]|uniref:efflux RND transporter permease subunit n=1 Tax=Moorena sp. SIO4G3 TaxID=2607821 RepID=UPI00142B90A9|nr:efflux RND transporter permease subunit [Moorena sp. SIO4G3]NEO77941.1 efflux RND transporter permease subunit [Moorena sp. SIO4G3]